MLYFIEFSFLPILHAAFGRSLCVISLNFHFLPILYAAFGNKKGALRGVGQLLYVLLSSFWL